jgi:hypothetical protein
MLDQTARYAEMCEIPSVKTKAVAAVGATSITVEHTRKFPTPTNGAVAVLINGQTIRYTGKTVSTLTGIPTTGVGSITTQIAANSTVQLLEYSLRYAPLKIYDARTETAELEERTDFEVVDGRRIRFYSNKAQTKFTILYESRPVYLVDQLPHEYRDQRLKLGVPQETLGRFPVAATLRKDWINRVG